MTRNQKTNRSSRRSFTELKPFCFPPGEGHPNARLSPRDIYNIRSTDWNIVRLKEVAEKYGTTISCIWKIRQRMTWTHLPATLEEWLRDQDAKEIGGGDE